MAHEEGGLLANDPCAQSPLSTQHSTFVSKYLESEKKIKRTSAGPCPGWESLDLFPEIYGPPHSHVSAVTGEVTSPCSFLSYLALGMHHFFTCSLAFPLGPLWQPAKGQLLPPPSPWPLPWQAAVRLQGASRKATVAVPTASQLSPI